MWVMPAPPRAAMLALALAASLVSAPLSEAPPILAASSVQPATPSPTNLCFVSGLFLDLFARAPSAAEEASGVSFLNTNTRGDYALSLLTTDEYRTLLIQG